MHLLIGAGCQFVPIAGPLVLMGYIYNVIEAKHRHGDDQFPDFDLDRLGAYLIRGVWPFLVALVAALPLFVLIVPAFLVIALLQAGSAQRGDPPTFTIALFVAGALAFTFLGFVWNFVTMPIMLRAGLSQDFSTAFSMEFVRSFLSLVWKEWALSIVFFLFTAPFVMLAGLLLFCIGIYPAAVVMTFAQFHMQYQLYELYLQRGGTPIPLKEHQ
jgi:hypothetical protein